MRAERGIESPIRRGYWFEGGRLSARCNRDWRLRLVPRCLTASQYRFSYIAEPITCPRTWVRCPYLGCKVQQLVQRLQWGRLDLARVPKSRTLAEKDSRDDSLPLLRFTVKPPSYQPSTSTARQRSILNDLSDTYLRTITISSFERSKNDVVHGES